MPDAVDLGGGCEAGEDVASGGIAGDGLGSACVGMNIRPVEMLGVVDSLGKEMLSELAGNNYWYPPKEY